MDICKRVRQVEQYPVDEVRDLLDAANTDDERLPLLLMLGFAIAPKDVEEATALNRQAAALLPAEDQPCGTSLLKRNEAHCAFYRRDYAAALTLVDEAERLCDQIENCDNGTLNVLRASAYMLLANYEQAQARAEQALKTAEAGGFQRVVTSALSVLGSVATLADNYALAIDCFQRCSEIYLQRGYVRGLGKMQNNLSQTYLKMEEYDRAREAAQMALKYYEEANDQRGVYFVNNTLGLLHVRLGDYATAESHMREAMRIAEALNDRLWRANTCHELAHIQRLRGEYRTAIPMLLDTLAQAEAIEAIYIVRDVHQDLAICYEMLGEYESALKHERASHGAAQQISNADVQAKLRLSQLQFEAELARKDAEVARRQLEHADRLTSMGKLASTIAHEINNPLQAVYGVLLLLEEGKSDDGEQDSDSHHELLSVAIEGIQRVQQMVTGMREMYQLDVGQVEALNLSDQVNRVLVLVRNTAEKQDVKISTDLPARLPPVHAVGRHIQQITLNLVLNALDAMPDGGTLSLRIIVNTREVMLSIEDDGDGMSEQQQAQAFQPFYTTRTNGSGLGLSICWNLVRHYEGTIELDSQPGGGTCVTVRFPIQPASEEASDYGHDSTR